MDTALLHVQQVRLVALGALCQVEDGNTMQSLALLGVRFTYSFPPRVQENRTDGSGGV